MIGLNIEEEKNSTLCYIIYRMVTNISTALGIELRFDGTTCVVEQRRRSREYVMLLALSLGLGLAPVYIYSPHSLLYESTLWTQFGALASFVMWTFVGVLSLSAEIEMTLSADKGLLVGRRSPLPFRAVQWLRVDMARLASFCVEYAPRSLTSIERCPVRPESLSTVRDDEIDENGKIDDDREISRSSPSLSSSSCPMSGSSGDAGACPASGSSSSAIDRGMAQLAWRTHDGVQMRFADDAYFCRGADELHKLADALNSTLATLNKCKDE
jgi:hypothetical protein